MKRLYFLAVLALILLNACGPKSLDKHGGLVITAGFVSDSLVSKADKQLTVTLIQQRMDRLCKYNPKVELQGNKIRIELPLTSDTALFTKVIKTQGLLEIWESFEFEEVFPMLQQIDDMSASPNADESDQHPLFDVLQFSLYSNSYIPTGPVIGYSTSAADSIAVHELLTSPIARSIFPGELEVYPCIDANKERAWLAVKKTKSALISTEMIKTARVQEGYSGHPEITIELLPPYHEKWEQATRKNIGRSLPMLLDNQLYSYPKVMSEITGGALSISGNFDRNAAQIMTVALQAGPLPVPLQIDEVTQVPKK